MSGTVYQRHIIALSQQQEAEFQKAPGPKREVKKWKSAYGAVESLIFLMPVGV